MTVERRGGEWVLKGKTSGKVLGRHKTKADAEAQERAIQIAKARKAGRRIPERRGD